MKSELNWHFKKWSSLSWMRMSINGFPCLYLVGFHLLRSANYLASQVKPMSRLNLDGPGRNYCTSIENIYEKLVEWGSIRCKHIVRWQHLSQIKARLFWLVENIFFQLKTLLAKSGTSAATYDLMEPQGSESSKISDINFYVNNGP